MSRAAPPGQKAALLAITPRGTRRSKKPRQPQQYSRRSSVASLPSVETPKRKDRRSQAAAALVVNVRFFGGENSQNHAKAGPIWGRRWNH